MKSTKTRKQKVVQVWRNRKPKGLSSLVRGIEEFFLSCWVGNPGRVKLEGKREKRDRIAVVCVFTNPCITDVASVIQNSVLDLEKMLAVVQTHIQSAMCGSGFFSIDLYGPVDTDFFACSFSWSTRHVVIDESTPGKEGKKQ